MSATRRSRRDQWLVLATAAVSCVLSQAASAQFLSVDMNGGDAQSGNNNSTNEGWDGTVNQPVNGVTWSPWGGRTTQGGDGNFLPFNPTTPVLGLTHSFTAAAVTSGTVTVALNAGGTATGFNSRDRGAPTGSANFGDMYRDLNFLARNTAQQLGAGPMVITLSGLNANTTYNYTGYSYDDGSPGQMVYGVTNPSTYDYADTGNASTGTSYSALPNALAASLAGPRLQWFAHDVPTNGDSVTSSTFKFTSDASGNATIYEWANSITGGAQSATVLNGFQLSNVGSSTWGATSSTTWGNANWAGGTPDGDGTVANFGTIAAAQTVTVEGSGRTVGVLNLNSPVGYTFSGGTLTMSNAFQSAASAVEPSFADVRHDRSCRDQCSGRQHVQCHSPDLGADRALAADDDQHGSEHDEPGNQRKYLFRLARH